MKTFFNELSVFMHYFRINIRAEAEQRVAFFLQQVGMMINNAAFLVSWILFINEFGAINGWGTYEVIGLWGFSSLVYGLTFSIFGGAAELKKAINLGVFDSVLLLPRSVYLRVFSLDIKTSSIGDIIFGVGFLILYGVFSPVSAWGLVSLLLAIIPAVLVMANILLITSCIAFFLIDSEHVSNSAFYAFLDPSLYPSGPFQGVARFVLIFILPSLVVGGFPIEIAASPTIAHIVLVWAIGIVWTVLGYATLAACTRFYESGNLTGARL
mgnify:CR=1 FL=1